MWVMCGRGLHGWGLIQWMLASSTIMALQMGQHPHFCMHVCYIQSTLAHLQEHVWAVQAWKLTWRARFKSRLSKNVLAWLRFPLPGKLLCEKQVTQLLQHPVEKRFCKGLSQVLGKATMIWSHKLHTTSHFISRYQNSSTIGWSIDAMVISTARWSSSKFLQLESMFTLLLPPSP